MALTNAQRQARWRVKRDAREKLRPDVVERELLAAAERCGGLSDQARLVLADRIADAAMAHLRRSQELAQIARRIRTFVTHT